MDTRAQQPIEYKHNTTQQLARRQVGHREMDVEEMHEEMERLQ